MIIYLSVSLFIAVSGILIFYFYILNKKLRNYEDIICNRLYYPFYDLIDKQELNKFIEFINSFNITIYTTKQ